MKAPKFAFNGGKDASVRTEKTSAPKFDISKRQKPPAVDTVDTMKQARLRNEVAQKQSAVQPYESKPTVSVPESPLLAPVRTWGGMGSNYGAAAGLSKTAQKDIATQQLTKRKKSGESPVLRGEKAAGSSYAAVSGVTGAMPSTPATPYGAGPQAGFANATKRKTTPKKEKTDQEQVVPAWMGLMGQTAEELERRHKAAVAEEDALSARIKEKETPAAHTTYSAASGGYKPREANPIPSAAAASGAWVSQEDKLLAPLRREASRKHDEVSDLAAAHFYRKNQEQLAKLETDAVSQEWYAAAKALTADLDTLSKALDTPAAYNGHDTRFAAGGEELMRKYGTDDLQTLQRTLKARKEEMVKQLAAQGYDFEDMAKYDRRLRRQETYIKTNERMAEEAEKHPFSASVLSTVVSPIQGFDFVRKGLEGVGHSNARELGSYVPMDAYDMYATNMVQTLRGTVSQKIEENTDWDLFGQNVAAFLYNTGMSMADSALQVATLGKGAPFLMGLSSAANTTKEILERGGSNEQAFWGGLAAGAAECVFEKVSVEGILNLDFGDGWKDAIKAVLAQGGVEASEEMLTEVANIVSNAMLGDRFGIAAAVKEYEDQGIPKDKAWLRATLDSISDITWAGAGGFVSGAGMAGGKLAIEQGGNAIYNSRTRRQQSQTAEKGTGSGAASRLDTDMGVDSSTAQNPVEGTKNAPVEGAAGLPRMTMEDFTDTESPVWRNVAFEDTETKSKITQNVHQQMVSEGRMVTIPEETTQRVGQSYPDLRAQKKADRTAVIRQKMTDLKKSLRQFLGGMKGTSFEFEVNGSVLEATLYGTGIREVMEKVTQDKAAMLYHSAEIFKEAQYLYSTPDSGGDPNIYRWNYFYTPVQIGNEVVGVRIAVRDMVPTESGKMDSQIYNWGIKRDTPVDGGGPGQRPNTTGVSLGVSEGTLLDGEGDGKSRKSHSVSSDVPGSMPLDGEGRGPKVDSHGVSSGVASMDSIPQTSQDVNPDGGDAGYWNSLMETAERGEAVDQGQVETEEEINARIQGAMSEWMKSLNQVNAQAEVRNDLPEDRRGLGQKVRDTASSAYRQFVDSGAEIEKMGKELGDKTLYPYYNAARQSTSAAGYMLRAGGRQMSVAGETVGSSLADIFQPIRDKGDDYYTAFQTFLYHMHNIDRMSRDNATNVSEALRQINEFDEMMAATRPELASMPEIDLTRDAAMGDEAAQQRLELLNAYQRARGIRNKSVFSNEVTAEVSRTEAAELLRAHPEFAKLATQVYQYSDNLLQYRVDSGLVTQEFADKLRQIYPHYVPTFRVTEGTQAGGKKKGARVGKTVGRATGGNGDLMPLHTALARQTDQVVRNGTLNRLGRRILGDYDQNRQGAGKYIYKVEEALQSISEDTFDLLEDPTPKRENTFTIYEDGKALQLTLSKGMYQAIDALMPKNSGWRSEDSYKLPARATTLFKELTTGKNPGFLVRNFFRDLQEGMVYSESTLRWLRNFPKAYQGIRANSPEWQLFQSLGGVYSSVFDYQKGYKLEETGKNVVSKFLGKVEAANSVIEMAPRFAEFLSYLEKHGRSQDSVMEALNRAAEITTNFGKSGEAGKFLNRTFVPFLNPGIQGANKMLKTALGRNGAKACLKLWLLGGGVLGLGVRALNDLINGDDEDYEDVRDSAKDTNWLIPIGDGRYIKIPMGRDASSLGIIASRLIATAHGDEVDWGDAFNTIMNQSAPSNPLKTNILAAWLDADLLDADSPGKTWYGGNIESQRLQSLAPGQRFDEDTDYFSKWLGGVLNISPKKINYVLDQYSGVVGEYVLPLMTPSKNKSIVSTFTSNFVLDSVTQNSLSSDFYATSDKIKYAKNGGDGAMAVVNRFWGKQSDAVSDLNKALRDLENDTTLPNKEKQEKIREAKAVIGGVQKNALEALEKYEAAARKYYTGDSDAEIKRAYREANREVFGAEYALQVNDKKVYERAVALNQAGVDFDTYYQAYFATRGTDGKEMKDNQKRNVLKGMNVSDEVKIALYTDLVTDGRDEDIAAAQAAGLPFNKFLDAQNKHSEINAQKGVTKNTKQAEFSRWLDSQLLTPQQETALKEAFGFYGMVKAGESKYETLTQVGWDSDTAWDTSKKLDMLLPPPGKESVTSTQRARVIVDSVSDNTQRLAALAEFVDEGTYNKLEIAYQYRVDPVVFVFYKEQVESIRAQTGKDSLTQAQTTTLLRRFAGISDQQRAALWQLQNTSWKPQSNPFDRGVGQRVYNLYQQRKGK